jgi:uncharacterized protein YndB with AHSA1/START domain
MRILLAFLMLALGAPALAQEVTVSERRETDGTTTLSHETIVPAPVAEVWMALATPEGWRTWAVPAARWVEGEADVMETTYNPQGGPGATIRQHMLARIPGRLLVFRTVKAPDGFPHFETFRRTTGFIEIEPAGEDRTRVRLTGTGYADNEAGRALLGFFRDGNRISLERLRDRFVTGPIDWSREAR